MTPLQATCYVSTTSDPTSCRASPSPAKQTGSSWAAPDMAPTCTSARTHARTHIHTEHASGEKNFYKVYTFVWLNLSLYIYSVYINLLFLNNVPACKGPSRPYVSLKCDIRSEATAGFRKRPCTYLSKFHPFQHIHVGLHTKAPFHYGHPALVITDIQKQHHVI